MIINRINYCLLNISAVLMICFFPIKRTDAQNVRDSYFVIGTSVYSSVIDYMSSDSFPIKPSQKQISVCNFSLAKLYKEKCIGENVETITIISDSIHSEAVFNDLSYIYLKNVKELFLDMKKINSNQIDFTWFTSLQSLSIICPTLDMIPQSIFKLEHLKYIQIIAPIKSIPKEIKNISTLEEIEITASNIETLPKHLKYLTHLKKINVSSNSLLKNIASGALSSDSIEYISFDSCYLLNKELPAEVYKLKMLKVLNLHAIPFYTNPKKEQIRLRLPNTNVW